MNTNFENVDAILDKYFDNLDFLPMDSWQLYENDECLINIMILEILSILE